MPISAKTLDFLVENRLNNSRVWYQEHKAQYRELVLAPLAELVEQLAPTLREMDPKLVVEPRVDRSISRIYRDTRFSKDKTLYRDVMWLAFMRDKKIVYCPPGFFFEFSPSGFRYGCGYYSLPTDYMDAVRSLVLSHDRSFLRAQEVLQNQPQFALEGERYKRPHFPDAPPDEREWLERKGLSVNCNSKDWGLLFSEELSYTLAEGFRRLKPVYEFFLRANTLAQAEK